MKKIVFAAALIAGVSGHAQAQFQSNWNTGQQNRYDDTERMNEQNRQMWHEEEPNRNQVLQSGGIAGRNCPPAALTCGY